MTKKLSELTKSTELLVEPFHFKIFGNKYYINRAGFLKAF